MKNKIANLIKYSLPKYDDKDPMNVKILKGNPISIQTYLKILLSFKDEYAYNKIAYPEYTRNETSIFKNVYAKGLVERNLHSALNRFKKNKLNTFLDVLKIVNAKVYNKVINIINKEGK